MDAPAQEKPVSEARGRGTAQFVVIFVCSVLSLLVGYHAVTEWPVNDWYLFQVAKNTTWCLDRIGERCSLEDMRQGVKDPARIRALLDAWHKGEKNPVISITDQFSKEPLSAWEHWQYRAQKTRLARRTDGLGPHVTFVLRKSVKERLQDRQTASARLQSEGNGESAAAKALEKEIASIKDEAEELKQHPDDKRNGDRRFAFVVVSECGAIEVMAIFIAAVLAFPAGWVRKLIGLALGLPVMYLVNVFRLTCLAIIGALDAGGQWFNFSHYYLWQSIYIVFVVAVWLLWVEFVVYREHGWVAWLKRLFQPRIGRLAYLCAKFLLFAVVLAVAWWSFLPVYSWALMEVVGIILRTFAHVPIEAGEIRKAGILNTESLLAYRIAGTWLAIPVALLITNIPPYTALVMATAGLSWRRRLANLGYGCTLLVFGHVVFLLWAVLIRWWQVQAGQGVSGEPPQIYAAVLQFYLTLPFLLWIVFPYWDKLSESRRSATPMTEATPEKTDTEVGTTE